MLRVLTAEEKLKLATTTMYYVETFTERDVNQCDDASKVNIVDRKDRLLVRACKRVFNSCLMEGTCFVSIAQKMQMLNYDGRLQNVSRFKVITNSECKFGHGATTDKNQTYKRMCVDPFYSVAADLQIYKLGDVIYLPAVRGLVLPNGQIHDGYFIVRDNGGGVDGYGRFDFFTGFFTTKNSQNPFLALRLHDEQSFPEYFQIDGAEADRVRKDRNFPLLPVVGLRHK